MMDWMREFKEAEMYEDWYKAQDKEARKAARKKRARPCGEQVPRPVGTGSSGPADQYRHSKLTAYWVPGFSRKVVTPSCSISISSSRMFWILAFTVTVS